MSGLRFIDAPPPDGRGLRHAWTSVAATLRGRPGEWAVVGEGISHTTAHRIKTGRIRAFQPAGHFEAVSRRRGDGEHDVYARFVGASSPNDDWDSLIEPVVIHEGVTS